ncbi:MAG: PD-(D/E)XK nuclease family protein [Alphaproteobacteria bacterium]
MTRAADRLYIGGWRSTKSAENTWYDFISTGLDGLAKIAEDEVLAADPELDGGPILRLSTAQIDPVTHQTISHQIDSDEHLPSWVKAIAPPDPIPPRPLIPSAPIEDDPPPISPLTENATDLRRRGIIIHRLLQVLPDTPLTKRKAVAANYLQQKSHNLNDIDQEALANAVIALLNTAKFADVFAPGSLAEVPVIGRLDSSRGPRLITGQIDRLVVMPDRILAVDYKTGRLPPATPQAIAPAYLRQMATYRAVLSQIYPDRPVLAALLWTEGPSLMEIPKALLDQYDPVA